MQLRFNGPVSHYIVQAEVRYSIWLSDMRLQYIIFFKLRFYRFTYSLTASTLFKIRSDVILIDRFYSYYVTSQDHQITFNYKIKNFTCYKKSLFGISQTKLYSYTTIHFQIYIFSTSSYRLRLFSRMEVKIWVFVICFALNTTELLWNVYIDLQSCFWLFYGIWWLIN